MRWALGRLARAARASRRPGGRRAGSRPAARPGSTTSPGSVAADLLRARRCDVAEHLLGLAERLASARARQHRPRRSPRQAAHPLLLVTPAGGLPRLALDRTSSPSATGRTPTCASSSRSSTPSSRTVAGHRQGRRARARLRRRSTTRTGPRGCSRHGAKRGHARPHAGRALAAAARRLRRRLRLPGRRHREGRRRRRHRHERPAAARCSATAARSCTRCRRAWATPSSRPLYEVLEAPRRPASSSSTRSRASGCTPSGDGVDEIEVVPQVELAATSEYEPARRRQRACPAGRASRSGTSSTTASSSASGVDFEAEPNPLGRDPHARSERGTDFDEVVLGIPVGALRADLRRADRARRALPRAGSSPRSRSAPRRSSSGSSRAADELGWAYGENSVAGCYVEPLDTYCDMTHLIPREAWPPARSVRRRSPTSAACSTTARARRTKQATERVEQNAVEFLERDLGVALAGRARAGGALRLGASWSTATSASGPDALRLPVLAREHLALGALRAHAGRLGRAPPALGRLRLRQPGARRRLDRRTAIDGGCVEAAVISGMQAARALTGDSSARSPAQSTAGCSRAARAAAPTSSTAAAPPRRRRSCRRGRTLRSLLLEGDGNAHRRPRRAGCSTCRPGRGVDVPGARLERDVDDRATSSGSPRWRQPFDRWGTVQRDHGVVLGPGARRPRPRRRLRRRSPRLGRARTCSSTTRCPTWAGARPTATRRRWAASTPRTGSASAA